MGGSGDQVGCACVENTLPCIKPNAMPKATIHIGLLSDTHSHWDDRMTHHLSDCDEIWHAGDLGSLKILDEMHRIAPTVRVVFGNIDDHIIRAETSEFLHWEIQGLRFSMAHIGGRPGRYAKGIRQLLDTHRPNFFICGHSHLLKIQSDPSFGGLYLNPGAAGVHGFHRKRTMIKFDMTAGSLTNVRVVELGDRVRKRSNQE